MNFLSENTWAIRLFVRDWNPTTCEWSYVRAERVGWCPNNAVPRKSFHMRYKHSMHVILYVQNWDTMEFEPLYTVTAKQISICLDKLHIVCYQFDR